MATEVVENGKAQLTAGHLCMLVVSFVIALGVIFWLFVPPNTLEGLVVLGFVGAVVLLVFLSFSVVRLVQKNRANLLLAEQLQQTSNRLEASVAERNHLLELKTRLVTNVAREFEGPIQVLKTAPKELAAGFEFEVRAQCRACMAMFALGANDFVDVSTTCLDCGAAGTLELTKQPTLKADPARVRHLFYAIEKSGADLLRLVDIVLDSARLKSSSETKRAPTVPLQQSLEALRIRLNDAFDGRLMLTSLIATPVTIEFDESVWFLAFELIFESVVDASSSRVNLSWSARATDSEVTFEFAGAPANWLALAVGNLANADALAGSKLKIDLAHGMLLPLGVRFESRAGSLIMTYHLPTDRVKA